MVLDALVAWGVSPSARWAAVGAGLVAVFLCGRASVPEPEPQVICAPVLVRVQECLDDLVQAHKVCAERVLEGAEAARAQERTACDTKAREGSKILGARACEVCEASKRRAP